MGLYEALCLDYFGCGRYMLTHTNLLKNLFIKSQ